ncbi:MAG TPA: hypothetical protein P5254_01345 [Aquihabitans sp.]|nr:hypothetical protein [Aquihabitans sp.]
MSRPTLPFDLTLDRIRVTPWHDPVVEAVGYDPRSPYVERFWLALLGPSTTLLLRRIAAALEVEPDGFDLELDETAKAIGLGMRGGTNGPFLRAIARTGQFHLSRPDGPGALAVRTRISGLTHHQLERLPPSLQAEHRRWVGAAPEGPTAEERRTRARRLALSLLELGEAPEAAEVQLHRWKVHPAMAHEAMRWALARTGERRSLVAAADGDGMPTGMSDAPGLATRRPRPATGPADDAA